MFSKADFVHMSNAAYLFFLNFDILAVLAVCITCFKRVKMALIDQQ